MNNTVKLSESEISMLLSDIPGWHVELRDGVFQLEKTFNFTDFKSTMAFCNQIAEESEIQNHHPSMLIEWGKVRVTWWTHSIGGLQAKDFMMSARTEALFPAETQ